MTTTRATIFILTAILGIQGSSAAQGASLQRLWTLTPTFAVATKETADLNSDGRAELVLIGETGEVRHWRPGQRGEDSGRLHGRLDLPDPSHSLISIATLTPGGPARLIVLGPRGVMTYGLTNGAFGGEGRHLLSRRVRFTMRTGAPQASDFVKDVNGDQRPDVLIPSSTHCSLYLNLASKDPGEPRFKLTSRVENSVQITTDTGSQALSSQWSSSIEIPDLSTKDVNGDGRSDLISEKSGRTSYHMQRADGSFPEKPDVVFDPKVFRDTTPKASFRLGQTIAMDNASLRTRDLTGDDLPDYVVSHRRKVWVFHATKAGPQFTEPASILKTTEDISFATLVNLDDDQYPDLLLFRLQAPSISTLLTGLMMQWDIKIEAIGYRNSEQGAFSRRPTWTSTTTVRAPAILDLLRRLDGIAEKFQAASEKFRHAVEANLDGNQHPDILMQTEDKRSLEFWIDTPGIETRSTSTDRQIRKFVFEDEDHVWDIERMLGLMRNQAASREARMTKGAPRSGSIDLRDPDKFQLDYATTADFNGDGREEVLLRYRDIRVPSRSTFDVLALEHK